MIELHRVQPEEVQETILYFAENIHEDDQQELKAMGRFSDTAAQEALSHGVGATYCFTASIHGKGLAVGGYDIEEGTVWFITTKHVDSLTRRERVLFGLSLKGVMQRLLKENPGVYFRNIVSMHNKNHIRLIKSLGGKGFNTLYENVKSGSLFYPFYFYKQ